MGCTERNGQTYYTVKTGETYKLPKILVGYMDTIDLLCDDDLSKERILNEAEWCLYNAYQNEASAAYSYHPQSKMALQRFVENLREEGIKPERDFD